MNHTGLARAGTFLPRFGSEDLTFLVSERYLDGEVDSRPKVQTNLVVSLERIILGIGTRSRCKVDAQQRTKRMMLLKMLALFPSIISVGLV